MSRYDDPPYKYAMYLVVSELLEDYEPFKNLIQLLENFEKLVSDKVHVIIPARQSFRVTRLYVLGLDWDAHMRKQLEQVNRPFLLIMRTRPPTLQP